MKHYFAVLLTLLLLLPFAAQAKGTATQKNYIVVFKDSADAVETSAQQLVNETRGQLKSIYRHAVKGVSLSLSEAMLEKVKRNAAVKYVEEDIAVQAYRRSLPLPLPEAQSVPTGVQRVFAEENAYIAIDGYDERVDVDVAIIDTGIDFQHPDLVVAGGVDCSSGSCVAGGDDDNYHGTHVAGTVAAIDNGSGVVGVAPGARLWAVKVLGADGSGTLSGVLAGIDWVTAQAQTIEVANMSLGAEGYSQAMYDAIQAATVNGVAFAVAAGNEADDAGLYSPAAFDNVLTVSALADFDGLPGGSGSYTCAYDQDDSLASFSNFGEAIDIAAPGLCIYSTVPLEQGSYATLSGTSMASPHVAGALALLCSLERATDATGVNALYAELIAAGNSNWTDDSGDGIQEALLDVSDLGADVPLDDDNSLPTLAIVSPSSGSQLNVGETVTFSATANDEEDGDLSAMIQWQSDIDGALGNGSSLTLASLTLADHQITASVTDSAGETVSQQVAVSVVEPQTSIIELSIETSVKRLRTTVYLSWQGAGSELVDIYRDGTKVVTTTNDGSYAERILSSDSPVYQICESNSSVCSTQLGINE